ncbi:hypothetical protein Tco_1332785 [Tanacetum coccineum]
MNKGVRWWWYAAVTAAVVAVVTFVVMMASAVWWWRCRGDEGGDVTVVGEVMVMTSAAGGDEGDDDGAAVGCNGVTLVRWSRLCCWRQGNSGGGVHGWRQRWCSGDVVIRMGSGGGMVGWRWCGGCHRRVTGISPEKGGGARKL